MAASGAEGHPSSRTGVPADSCAFGPADDVEFDGKRLGPSSRSSPTSWRTGHIEAWVRLAEIEEQTGIPQSSASAELRHMRSREFGSHIVEKRRRETAAGGTWEYRDTGRAYPEELYGQGNACRD